MAAASSGEKAVAMTAAFPPQLNFDDGATPQEGTKEHMSVVEVRKNHLITCVTRAPVFSATWTS